MIAKEYGSLAIVDSLDSLVECVQLINEINNDKSDNMIWELYITLLPTMEDRLSLTEFKETLLTGESVKKTKSNNVKSKPKEKKEPMQDIINRTNLIIMSTLPPAGGEKDIK